MDNKKARLLAMSENLTAFDIGESQLKIVKYAGGTVRKAVCAALPDNLVAGGEILSMDAMTDFIKNIAKDNGLTRGNAGIILPDSKVYTRNVDVPPMTDAQLGYNLPFEFKDYLTQDKGDYYFDYAVRGYEKDESGTVKQMHLFACATLKKTINDYREMLRRAGFTLKVDIPEEAAYGAILADRKDIDSDTCFVDIGYNAIRMQFFKGDSFVTRRMINLGICDLVSSIADVRGVDSHMAYEHVKSDYEGAITQPDSLELYRSMAVEIMKAVNFYNYNNREQMLRKVYLCGGGAALKPIRDAINELTEMEVNSAKKLLHGTGLPEESWLYIKALGCAMQG